MARAGRNEIHAGQNAAARALAGLLQARAVPSARCCSAARAVFFRHNPNFLWIVLHSAGTPTGKKVRQ
jgi:hypothetical protein